MQQKIRKVRRFQPTFEFATGTLISDLFVVTVASFYDAINDNDKEREKEKKESIRVKPGASVWAKKDCCNEILQWQEIEQEIYFHPYYEDDNYKPSNDISYNVALIKLKRRLSFYEDGVTKIGVRQPASAQVAEVICASNFVVNASHTV